MSEARERMSDGCRPVEACPRRQWLAEVLRGLALAGLAAVAAVLGFRRPSDPDRADCRHELPCSQCGLNRQCALPPAAVWRGTQEGDF